MRLLYPVLLFVAFLVKPMHADELPVGQIGLAPSMFTGLRLDGKPVNESIRLFNFKEEPVTVKVSVHNWTTDKDNKVKIIPPDSRSLDQWMVVNPLRFTVPPKKSYLVRFSILPSEKPAPGEYRAIIYFTEEPPANDTLKTMAGRTRFRIGTGIYAIAEPTKKQAILHSLRLDNNRLYADIQNTGNCHVRFRGKYVVWEKRSFPGVKKFDKLFKADQEETAPEGFAGKGHLNRFPILPGTRRTIVTTLPLIKKKGTYIVAVKDTLAGTAGIHTLTIAQ